MLNVLSAVRFYSSSGIDIRLGQYENTKYESDVRHPIYFGRDDKSSHLLICKEQRAIRCWIHCGNEINFWHSSIYKSSSAINYWIPSNKEQNLLQLEMDKICREVKSCKPFIGKDKKLLHSHMYSFHNECEIWSPSKRLSILSQHSRLNSFNTEIIQLISQ